MLTEVVTFLTQIKTYIFYLCFLSVHEVSVWSPDLFNIISTECKASVLTLSESDISPSLKEI